MWRGWTRAPTDRERKTCGPSLRIPSWIRRRFLVRQSGPPGALADTSAFSRRMGSSLPPENRPKWWWEARHGAWSNCATTKSTKALMRGARWRPGTVSAWIGNDSGIWLSSSSGTSVPCCNGARDHEIRQSRDAEPGHRHIEQQVGIVAGEGAGYGEPVDAFMGVEGPLRPRRSRQRQAIMLQEIGGHARRSVFLQIERTGADNACRLGDLARHQR